MTEQFYVTWKDLRELRREYKEELKNLYDGVHRDLHTLNDRIDNLETATNTLLEEFKKLKALLENGTI